MGLDTRVEMPQDLSRITFAHVYTRLQSIPSWQAIGLPLIVIPTLYGVVLVLYRLFLHPLARFPGPKIAAATKWYEFYYDVLKAPGGQFFHEIRRMHDEYGPIIRINPEEIHVCDPTFLETLYATNPTKRNKYTPSAEMAGLTKGTHGTVDHDVHRRRRQANSKMFSKRAFASAKGLIKQHVDELAQTFEAKAGTGELVELQTTFLAYTTDVLYHYMFDIETGYQRDAEAAESWRHSMEAVAQATPFLKQFPWINAFLLSLPEPIMNAVVKLQPDVAGLLGTFKLMSKVVDQYITKKASRAHTTEEEEAPEAEAEASKIRPPTIFHSIDQSNLPASEKTPERLMQEGLTVLFAGGETGSRMLAHTVFHLLDQPEVLGRVRREIAEAAGGSNEVPDLKVLETLPWFTASIRESLRLRAAITSRLPLVAPKPLVYDKWVIPAGTAISMSFVDILHSEELYPEPLKFRPQRWFSASELQNKYFVPFSKGTRSCIGMDFAYGEMYMSLATLLCRFDMELVDTIWERDVAYSRDCFLGESDPKSLGIRVRIVKDTKMFANDGV